MQTKRPSGASNRNGDEKKNELGRNSLEDYVSGRTDQVA
jgi:hypothetical protein